MSDPTKLFRLLIINTGARLALDFQTEMPLKIWV